MRVIAGTAGGRRLIAPRGNEVRPTQDRVKEAVFSKLGPARLVDATVLDGCAGSGGLGIEALSRGARSVDFVEQSHAALRALRTNLQTVGFAGQSRVHARGIAQFLGHPTPSVAPSGTVGGPFDLVFLDPPYGMSDAEVGATLQALVAGGWLVPDALIVVERAATSDFPVPEALSVSWKRRYGDTLIVILS